MKKRIIVISIICILVIGFPYVLSRLKEHALKDKQEELAKSLGVKVEDYPLDFPTDYFYTILKPGLTLAEVHNIVQGYESVYNCYGTDELYYYFSNDENDALRFEFDYDKQGHFVEMRSEDPNSRSLGGLGEGCSEGLLEVNKLSP